MIVQDLMTRTPASVRPAQNLADAAQLLWDCDCGALPVVDGETQKLIGMLTDRDICMATWSRGKAPGAISVSEVMSPQVIACRPSDTIRRAETIMSENQIRRLPVVDSEQRLQGILSLADIARATESAARVGAIGDPSGDGLVATLAGICVNHGQKAPRELRA
jgi:CBS domain-containing protein